jgi:sulfane dehydrogenase subunit SoxC
VLRDGAPRRDALPRVKPAGVSRRTVLLASVPLLAPASLLAGRQREGLAARLLVKPCPADFFIDHGLNQETRLERLAGYLTPASRLFVRNHSATPTIDLARWRLRVEGRAVGRPLELSFDELLRLPTRSVICFVECAGNGRVFFGEQMGRRAEGTQWRFGAIGVAEWTGVPLGAVLELARLKAGLPRDVLNVLIEGLDRTKVSRPVTLEKALDEETLLAYAINGEPLPPDHGYPVRAVVPGWTGINSIKWVGRIEVAEEPIGVLTTTRSYVLDGPDYPDRPPLRLQTMKSAVALPWPATVAAGWQRLRGFAWSPVGRIARVEVSVDGGATWSDALLGTPNLPRAWVRWEFAWNARPGRHTVTVRATDEAGHRQPAAIPWNRLGYGYNVPVPHPVLVT